MTLKKNVLKGAAVVTTVGAIAALGLTGGNAQADPQFTSAFVGVGSDTTQDVLNGLAGYAPAAGLLTADSRYEPAVTGTGQQVVSFNALNPDPNGDTCITTKLGGPAFDRPNGSTNGREALSRAIDGTGWGTTACTGAGTTDVGGQIDFARSSDGPASGDGGTALTYSELGRDAISLAFYRTGVAGNSINPVTSTSNQVKTRWTRAEITGLYTAPNGSSKPFLADDGLTTIQVRACGIQTGSGTYKSVLKTFAASAAQDVAATNVCNPLEANRLQENDAAGLKVKGDAAPAGTQVVIGFAAGPYIAKSNGVANPSPQTNAVGLAAITNDGFGNNLGVAVSGSFPNFLPVSTFYNNGTFGRTVYNVVDTALINSAFGNTGLKEMFKDPDGALAGKTAICEETATIQRFGFLVTSTCGFTGTTGSLIPGQSN